MTKKTPTLEPPDPYTLQASTVYGVKPEEVTPEQRRQAKLLFYYWAYTPRENPEPIRPRGIH